MKKLQNEIKIGVTLVIAMLIAVIGFRVLQDVPLFRPSLQLYSVFDRVDGISSGSSVFMSGVKIGSVNRVILAGPDSVVVQLNITYHEGIPVGSRAIIESADLIGNKRVRIDHSGAEEMIPFGGYIQGSFDYGALAELEEFALEMKPDLQQTTSSLSGILTQVEEILSDGGKEDIRSTIASLDRSSREVDAMLRRRSGDLEETILSLRQFMAQMDTLSSDSRIQLDQLLVNLEQSTRELGVISEELSGVSSEIHLMMRSINEGEGTVGKLIHNPSLYQNLDSLAVNLKDLSRMLKDDPGYFLKHMRLIDIF